MRSRLFWCGAEAALPAQAPPDSNHGDRPELGLRHCVVGIGVRIVLSGVHVLPVGAIRGVVAAQARGTVVLESRRDKQVHALAHGVGSLQAGGEAQCVLVTSKSSFPPTNLKFALKRLWRRPT